MQYLNRYRHCDKEWGDTSDTCCADVCPTCSTVVEPFMSVRKFTEEEQNNLFLVRMKEIAENWERKVEQGNVLPQIAGFGVAYDIMRALDGDDEALPAFNLTPKVVLNDPNEIPETPWMRGFPMHPTSDSWAKQFFDLYEGLRQPTWPTAQDLFEEE